jgi:hypothetical protein
VVWRSRRAKDRSSSSVPATRARSVGRSNNVVAMFNVSSLWRVAPGLSASILQAFLRASPGISFRACGRRCLAGNHLRTWCPPKNPLGSALDQESPGSIPGGATSRGRSASAGGPLSPSRFRLFKDALGSATARPRQSSPRAARAPATPYAAWGRVPRREPERVSVRLAHHPAGINRRSAASSHNGSHQLRCCSRRWSDLYPPTSTNFHNLPKAQTRAP